MTNQETSKLIAKIHIVYPKFLEKKNDKDLLLLIETWQEMLEDLTLEQCLIALKIHIASMEGQFIPSIFNIRNNAINILKEETMNAGEAWTKVIKLIQRYGIYGLSEAIQKLDSITKQTVDAIGYKEICMCDIDKLSILRAQFSSIYESLQKRNIKELNLPTKVKQQIEMLKSKYLISKESENKSKEISKI